MTILHLQRRCCSIYYYYYCLLENGANDAESLHYYRGVEINCHVHLFIMIFHSLRPVVIVAASLVNKALFVYSEKEMLLCAA